MPLHRQQTCGSCTPRVSSRRWSSPFASLHQLCAPLLEAVEQLPPPQRGALEVAFGRTAGPAPDRFLVGLAVLTLLSGAAEERPLLCVVDDAQWLDEVSAKTLAFVARRLLAEPVGLLLAARTPAGDLRGLPELEVLGLRNGDARALLRSGCHVPARRADPRSHRRRDAGQSPRAAGAAPWVVGRAACRWVRPVGRPAAGVADSARGELSTTEFRRFRPLRGS